MKRYVWVTIFVILIALYSGFLSVYGQERRRTTERGEATAQRAGANMGRMLIRLMDLDNDGKVSQKEYMKLFVDADGNVDGSLTQREITQYMSKKRQEMPGMMQSSMEQQAQQAVGPDVGEEAPDFALRTLGGEIVKLSDFKGKKPVVLVFGSYT